MLGHRWWILRDGGPATFFCREQLDKGIAMRNWLETIVFFLFLLIAHSAEAQLYVAKTGSDANPCTSALAPCHTINGAVAKGARR
jgi:hypothetical protein